MANKDKIIASLYNAKLCDDCLSVSSGVVPRQTVYSICRSLSETSTINRHHGECDHCHKPKLTNSLLDWNAEKEDPKAEKSSIDYIRPWFWEGNVQSKVVSYLVTHNYTIRSVADTASRTSGKDIIALSPAGDELWISVKGYPEKSQNTQARHWFSGAVFDLVLYRGENPDVKLGIALPDGFATYRNLLPRIKWLKETVDFQIYWINEEELVRVE
ncbi:hypothetical protein NYE40_23985 [Paenibacillus sp. FSL W8-1187]|uniref:hypothetical protein n=1 Tax=Paenibacillus sp. FSL W8-1187 TaxID=2975339 RepID=UPI0030DBA07E